MTEEPKHPITSNDDAYAMSPNRETRPYVGFIPTTPQNDAGCLTLPPVSLPKDTAHCPAETAAAEPPDDPPGTRETSQGLAVTYERTDGSKYTKFNSSTVITTGYKMKIYIFSFEEDQQV